MQQAVVVLTVAAALQELVRGAVPESLTEHPHNFPASVFTAVCNEILISHSFNMGVNLVICIGELWMAPVQILKILSLMSLFIICELYDT